MSGTVSGTLSLNAQNFIANLVMAGQATEKEGKRMAGALKYIESQLRENERAARGAANTSPFTPAMASDLQRQQQEMRALRSETNRTREAMRQLPAQFTDVFTQLAGGQNPALILIQQGGQIRDSFGGIIPALQGVLSAINPVVLAYGALGVVAAATAYAFMEGRDQSKALQTSLILTGNAAGQTADSFDRVVRNAARASNTTAGMAREAAQALVSSGRFSPENLTAATAAVASYSKLSGEAADKVAADFARMGDGVAKWAAEHNSSLNFITGAQYAAIKVAEEMGDKERAIGIVLEALNGHLKTNAGWWDKLKQEASATWDAMTGYGRVDTIEQSIASVQTALEVARTDMARYRDGGGGLIQSLLGNNSEKRVAELEALLARLKQSKDMADQVAASTAKFREQQRAGISAQQQIDKVLEETKVRMTLNKELERYQKLFADAAASGKAYSAEEQKAVLDAIRKKFTPDRSPYEGLIADVQKYEQQTNMLGKAVKAEGEVEAWAAEQRKKIAEAAAKMSPAERALATAAVAAAEQRRIATLREMEARDRLVKSVQAQIDLDSKQYARVTGLLAAGDETVKGYIQQEQEIGKTAKELEKLNLERKLEIDLQRALAGVTNGDDAAAVYAAARRNAENARAALEQLQRSRERYEANPSNGVTSALQKYQEDTAKMASKTEQLVNSSLQRAEDAFVKFARTGKLSLSDLFGYWVEMSSRMMFKQLMGGVINAGGGANSFNLGTLWDSFRGWAGFANGLEYVPYDGFPAILHQGERVQTKMEAQSYRTDAAAMSSGAMQGAGGPPVQIIVQGDFGENARRYMDAALKTAAVKQQRRRGI